MNLIRLGEHFVQPQIILKISADDVFNQDLYRVEFPNDNDVHRKGWGWIYVINVVLLHQEKLTLKFQDEDSRNTRFAEIEEQIQNAKCV